MQFNRQINKQFMQALIGPMNYLLIHPVRMHHAAHQVDQRPFAQPVDLPVDLDQPFDSPIAQPIEQCSARDQWADQAFKGLDYDPCATLCTAR